MTPRKFRSRVHGLALDAKFSLSRDSEVMKSVIVMHSSERPGRKGRHGQWNTRNSHSEIFFGRYSIILLDLQHKCVGEPEENEFADDVCAVRSSSTKTRSTKSDLEGSLFEILFWFSPLSFESPRYERTRIEISVPLRRETACSRLHSPHTAVPG